MMCKMLKNEKRIIRKYDIASEPILKRKKIESYDHIESFVDGCQNDEKRFEKVYNLAFEVYKSTKTQYYFDVDDPSLDAHENNEFLITDDNLVQLNSFYLEKYAASKVLMALLSKKLPVLEIFIKLIIEECNELKKNDWISILEVLKVLKSSQISEQDLSTSQYFFSFVRYMNLQQQKQ